MQILCLQTQYHGQSLNLPDIGTKAIPADGIIDVPEAIAEMLCDDKNWQEVGKPAKTVKETKKEDKPSTTVVDEDTATMIAGLDGMDLKQLCELAEQAKIKGWEKFKTKENALRTLIKNQLQRAK